MEKLVTQVKHLRQGFGGPMPVRVRTERKYRRDEWLRKRFRSWHRQPVPDTFVVAIRAAEWLLEEGRAIRDAVVRTLDDRRGGAR